MTVFYVACLARLCLWKVCVQGNYEHHAVVMYRSRSKERRLESMSASLDDSMDASLDAAAADGSEIVRTCCMTRAEQLLLKLLQDSTTVPLSLPLIHKAALPSPGGNHHFQASQALHDCQAHHLAALRSRHRHLPAHAGGSGIKQAH